MLATPPGLSGLSAVGEISVRMSPRINSIFNITLSFYYFTCFGDETYQCCFPHSGQHTRFVSGHSLPNASKRSQQRISDSRRGIHLMPCIWACLGIWTPAVTFRRVRRLEWSRAVASAVLLPGQCGNAHTASQKRGPPFACMALTPEY